MSVNIKDKLHRWLLIITIMEDQMEKSMENAMESGIM